MACFAFLWVDVPPACAGMTMVLAGMTGCGRFEPCPYRQPPPPPGIPLRSLRSASLLSVFLGFSKGDGGWLVAAGGSYCAGPGSYGHHAAVYVYV